MRPDWGRRERPVGDVRAAGLGAARAGIAAG